jgi:hypothetical protein
MLSSRQHAINKKATNDIFYTPLALAKTAINMAGDKYKDKRWLDPRKGKGAFYDQFPSPNAYEGQVGTALQSR